MIVSWIGVAICWTIYQCKSLLCLCIYGTLNAGAGNSGNEFYLACAPNRFDKEGQCTFYITTEETTTVSVVISHKSVSGNSGSTVTTVKGSTTIYQLPTALTLGTAAMYAFRQSDFGVHFKAEGDKKVSERYNLHLHTYIRMYFVRCAYIQPL